MNLWVECALFFATVWWLYITVKTAQRFAPWVPSDQKRVRAALEMAEIVPGECFYDLGCGDGRVVFMAARDFGARAVGIEIVRTLHAWCVLRAWLGRYGDVTFRRGDLFESSVQDADVAFLYALEHTISGGVLEKLRAEMKPGSRVLSFRYPDPSRTADRVLPAEKEEYPVYLYRN